MIFRNDPRWIVPVLFVRCVMPLTAAFVNGRLERIRTIGFLLIFTAGLGLGACATAFWAIKKGQAR